MKSMLSALKRRIQPLMTTKQEHRHAMVGPAALWKMKRDFQIRFLRQMGLAPEHYLLDLGCGTLRGGIPLIEYLQPGHYFGIEVRAEALAEGRKELQEAGLEGKQPVLLQSDDVSQLSVEQQFDYAWAFPVLIHMQDPILDQTLGFIARRLAPDGTFYANVNIGEEYSGSWQGFPVVSRTLEFYREQCARHGLALADLGPLRELGHISGVEEQDIQRMLRITRSG
ncbi:SAM-dependent methyltransferase [Sedimenticola hydrogenitrophicus]|uniref:SAM-dependent methyltransferase n=1 Tax=Sedimenticola hydrogenitrophicus TaxID=2967975 RepID=UPI0023AE87B5|nr:class I SAM-dependent methyltransferase [Sedimenticola hydrogenitrophicus]